MYKNMPMGTIRKFALGVILIWAFFACYTLAESIGLVYNAQENNTKICESAISVIQQGVKIDSGRAHILFYPLYVTPTQNAFSNSYAKGTSVFPNTNQSNLFDNILILFSVLRL